MSAAAKRVRGERNWRLNELKVGDVVDVVKYTQVRDLVVSAWSRGIVIFKGEPEDDEARADQIEGSELDVTARWKIDIKYERDRDAQKRRFDLDDWRIAPPGTFVDDFDWRYDLKNGDTLDCQDDEKDWYKSTVAGTRTSRNVDGEEVPEIYVAFRTYHEEGSKTDEEGRRFFGWSERYDAWYGVTDP